VIESETMTDDSTFLATQMKILRQQAHERLYNANPDYRALVALDEAIAKAAPQSTRQAIPAPPPTWLPTPPPHIQGTAIKPIEHWDHLNAFRVKPTGPSHSQATAALLEREGIPLPVSILVPNVRGLGATLTGKDPEINLSSSLSRDKIFRSVRYQGRPCWWFADRPFPGEQGFGGLMGASAPAADDVEQKEEDDTTP
jgi:hypothetical protein